MDQKGAVKFLVQIWQHFSSSNLLPFELHLEVDLYHMPLLNLTEQLIFIL